jgi:hypothetical protein
MYKQAQIFLLAILLVAGLLSFAGSATLARPDDSDAFIGTWEGSWSGGSSGNVGMTFAKGAGGKLSGTISPKPEQGDGYTVPFKCIEVSGGKLTVKFEDPGGEVEITLVGTVEGKSAKGTYSVKPKGQDDAVDSGTWTVTRK